MNSPAPLAKFSQTENSLLATFKRQFSFKIARTTNDKDRVFRLRYEVYCQEIGYQPPGSGSEHLELDSHDSHSIHCFIEHKASGLAAGCLRLVLPDPEEKNDDARLPLQEYGGRSLSHPYFHPARLPKAQVCEISRFAIARPFRHKPIKNETLNKEALEHSFTAEEKKSFPSIIIALFLATYALVGMTKRRHVFAMMEPRLPRLLSMSGFHFTKVGETVNMHGTRNAFYIDHSKAEQEIHEGLIPLYLHIQNELRPQLGG
jgi:N-acyl amino acid synthase of PEP-CTERM/exosortase system